MTKAQVIALIDQYITTNGNEEITGAQTNSVMKALANQDIPFSEIASKPTTLSGYGITDAYTKSASDGRYLLNTTDELVGDLSVTGQVISNNLFTNNQGDGATLLSFITERPWSFKQTSTGASTALSLVESAPTGSKNFTIGDLTTPDKVTISSGSGNITTIGTVTGSNLSGTNTGDQTLSGLGGVPNTRSILAGTGLTGGGDLTANRTINVNFGTASGTVAQGNDSRINNGQTAYSWGNHASVGYALKSTQINTGNHLSGGGNLSANRTLTLTPTVDQWIVDSQGNQRMYFNSAATVSNGIILKASAATQRLQYRDVNNNQVFTVDDSGDVTARAFYESSDRRLKKNIEPLNYGLNEIEKINAHTWNWKNNNESDIGVIAQELETILPELVKTDEEGYKSVNYPKLIPVLINAIKELSNQVKALKNGKKS